MTYSAKKFQVENIEMFNIPLNVYGIANAVLYITVDAIHAWKVVHFKVYDYVFVPHIYLIRSQENMLYSKNGNEQFSAYDINQEYQTLHDCQQKDASSRRETTLHFEVTDRVGNSWSQVPACVMSSAVWGDS